MKPRRNAMPVVIVPAITIVVGGVTAESGWKERRAPAGQRWRALGKPERTDWRPLPKPKGEWR